jgi:uncharacterized protein
MRDWTSEKTTPARAALGLSVGIFIGAFPTLAIGSCVALYLASRLGLHQGAALSGSFVTNPLTAPLFYSLSYLIGVNVVGLNASAAHYESLWASVQHVGWAFLLGNAIVGLSLSLLFGFGLFFWLRRSSAVSGALTSGVACQ